MRYIWDRYDDYFGPGRGGLLPSAGMRVVRPYLQKWDVRTASRVDYFVAISGYVAERIKRNYQRSADVINPPVDAEYYFPAAVRPENFFLIVSAFAPYKRIDLAITAFNRLGYQLKIIGTGQDQEKLKKMAGHNIEFLGWQSDEVIREYYRRCQALIFPGVEDFGIVPLEAMSCGRPVIAFGEGGATETVVEGVTGIFFYEQTPESLITAVKKNEHMSFDCGKIREQALKFGKNIFKEKLGNFVSAKLGEK